MYIGFSGEGRARVLKEDWEQYEKERNLLQNNTTEVSNHICVNVRSFHILFKKSSSFFILFLFIFLCSLGWPQT